MLTRSRWTTAARLFGLALAITACNGGGGTTTSAGDAGSSSGPPPTTGPPTTGGDSTGGVDSTGGAGAGPTCAQSAPCSSDEDCCSWNGLPSGASIAGFPHLECTAGADYPNNWTCTPEGRCINPCDPLAPTPCLLQDFSCVPVDGVDTCVPTCQNIDTECTSAPHYMGASATCTGLADDLVTAYCEVPPV